MKRLYYSPLLILAVLAFVWSASGAESLFIAIIVVPSALAAILLACGTILLVKNHLAWHFITLGSFAAWMLLIGFTNFPLWMSFKASERSLSDLAAKIENGQTLSSPSRAGVFVIRKAGQRRDGSVYLWTDPRSGGPRGFVYQFNGGYNIWAIKELSDDWHYIAED